MGVAIGITAIQVLVEARAGDEISKTFRDNKPSADSAWFEPVKIMVNHKRHKRMLKLLSEHDSATVQQLMDWLSASAATVRRDIGWLAAKNQLTRTRGGAQKLQQKKRSFTLSSETFQNNIQNCAAEKRAIARYASTLCKDGETIIINGGTTTYMMVEFLVEKQLKILTNSFLMAERLLSTSDNEIILPGGKVYREQNVILSPFENDIAQHHYAAKMFMGVYGLSILGLMEADPLLIQAEKRLISQAEELIVLVDSSKFARKAGLILCGLNRVSCVITDTGASDSAVQLLEQYGVKVVTVEPEALACSRLDADADVQAMGSGGCDLDNDDDCETGDVRTGSFAPFKVAA